MSEEQEFADFELDVDLEGVEPWDGVYKLVPEGKDVLLEVEHVGDKTSRNSNLMAVFRFKIAAEQPRNPEYTKYAGQSVWNNYVFTEKAMGRVAQIAVACKAPLKGFKASNYMGAKIYADIIHSEGEPTVGPDGQERPAKTFANVTNERPVDAPAAETKKAGPPPAVKVIGRPTKGNATAPTPRTT